MLLWRPLLHFLYNRYDVSLLVGKWTGEVGVGICDIGIVVCIVVVGFGTLNADGGAHCFLFVVYCHICKFAPLLEAVVLMWK